MYDIDNIFKKYNITSGSTLVIGLSGGPDSMALLNMLLELRKKIDIKLVAAHVNHNVRKVSSKEKLFVEEYCKKKNVLFESMIIEKYGDDNFENEARSIRYKFFNSIIEKYNANFLLTAHHGDDLMETILMRLSRGSTLKGYSGFSEIVDKGNYMIIRPLIIFTKAQIEEYDKKNKIPYVIDKTNFLTIHTRNRYRKSMLPFLKKEDPNVNLKFLKFSKILEEYNSFIDSQVSKIFSKVYKNSELDIEKYLELEPLLQDKIIYGMLEKIYSDDLMLINDKHAILIKKIIKSKKSNTFVYLPNNIKAVKIYNKIKIEKEIDAVSTYEIELNDYVTLPNGHHLEVLQECDTNGNDVCRLSSNDVSLPLYVRTRKHGDKISGLNMLGHTKVKDLFINKKIPQKERELWPIIIDSKGKIVWVPNIKKSKFNKLKTEKCDIIIKYY